MGKIKKSLIKLSKKVTGKDLANEDSIGDVVNFMADNYQGGSSTMMLDLDEIIELNPNFGNYIDQSTVGCDAAKLFDYLSKGNTLAISYTYPNFSPQEKGIYHINHIVYEAGDILYVYAFLSADTNDVLQLCISIKPLPDIVFADSGETINVPGYGDVQDSFTCNKTYDEIIQMYEQGNTEYVITYPGGEPEFGVFSEATKEGNLYHFEVEPAGQLGNYGIAWDDTNQVFVLWNGVEQTLK